MRYKVDDEIFDDIEDVLDYCIEEDYHEDDDIEEWVNDIYGYITIAGTNYDAYDIIKKFDDGTIEEIRDDYCSNENDNDRSNTRYELRRASVGDVIECQRYSIEVIEDEVVEESGDYDGDDIIATTRLYIEEQRLIEQKTIESEKKIEKDLVSLFQTIGG